MIRTRYAPSPTGLQHPGSIRTALFAWLLARSTGGEFLLRVEDTDKAREMPGAIDDLQDSLNWLGLNWDGKIVKQSDRLDIYKEHGEILLKQGLAYADPFTPEQVEEFRNQAKAAKKPFLFRDFRPDKTSEWDGSQPLRFKTTDLKSHKWTDAVRGELSTGPEALDDFIILKSDGYPTYNFAHVVDDHLMEITHVLRGEEFIASIPKFLALYEAFGWQPPINATMPLVLGREGGKKLSKRDGAYAILEYRAEGYLPAAMNNFLVSLGWNDGTEQEIFSMEELVGKFKLERIQKSPARFDIERLIWLNGAHIRKIPLDKLYDLTLAKHGRFWPEAADKYDDVYKKKILGLIQERVKYFAEIPELTGFFFTDPEAPELKSDAKERLTKVIEVLDSSSFEPADLEDRLTKLAEKLVLKRGDLFKDIRVAVTGSNVSPGLFETLHELGKDAALRRLQKATGGD